MYGNVNGEKEYFKIMLKFNNAREILTYVILTSNSQ